MARDYVTLHVDRAARLALQRLQLDLQAGVRRRLTLGEVLMAAVAVAEAHPDEAVAAITAD